MKRGTPEHPKTVRLSRILEIEQWGAVGILEALWHFCARYAIQGDVGRWSNQEIADGLGWHGRHGTADQLIAALVQSRWLDECQTHRLIVHDWADHCDESCRKTLKNRGLSFLFPESSGKFEKSNPCLAFPEPEPEPEPLPPIAPQGARAKKSNGYCSQFETWWTTYPKKSGKEAANKSWAKAGKRIKDRLVCSSDEAAAFLLHVASDYARERKTEDPQFNYNPATWLNQGHYYDDPATWTKQPAPSGNRVAEIPSGGKPIYNPETGEIVIEKE